MYKAYLFDMDGTLVDTFDLIYKAFNQSLADNGKRGMTKKEFDDRLFGKPVDGTLKRLLGVETEEDTLKIMRDFQKHWMENLSMLKVFKDVDSSLEKLKSRKKKLGVVSTSPRKVIERTLGVVGILKYFDVIVGGDDVDSCKPHYQPIMAAVEELDVPIDEIVFVGDTIYDMQAGKNMGCSTVLLLNDYNKGVLEKTHPDKVIKSIKELLTEK